MKRIRTGALLLTAAALTLALAGCVNPNIKTSKDFGGSSSAASGAPAAESAPAPAAGSVENAAESAPASAVSTAEGSASSAAESTLSGAASTISGAETASGHVRTEEVTSESVTLDPAWEYAANSKISSGAATLYYAPASIANGHVVCINAGHGTKGGSDVKTLCHPDGSPKVTGGTTGEGATEAIAVSTGIDMKDGTHEAEVTKRLALVVKDKLLAKGYDVLMIRETDDVQLDNVARTVIANNRADCHIALHYDGTDFDKGVFFMSVPSADVYRNMEPVKSHFEEHNRLGRTIVKALENAGFKLFEGGEMEMDLTQTSYSTVPSIDLEVGDSASDYSEATLNQLADGIAAGLDTFFAS